MGDMQERIERLAAPQLGVVLGSQLISDGATRAALRHAVQTGRLEQLLPGVFRQVSTLGPSLEQQSLAAVLAGGDGTAISHATAASMFGFSGFPGRPIHVSLPERRKRAIESEALVVHRPTRAFETLLIGKVPVTTLPRTIVDCAETLRGAPLEIMLDDAHQRFGGVAERLRRELATLKHVTDVPGGAELLRILDAREGRAADSPAEVRFWRLLRKARLPPFHLQVEIRNERGEYVMTVDFAWVLHKVAVHFDSFRWHARRTTFDRDAMQRSALAGLDWFNFVVTEAMLENGQCIPNLERVLKAREPQHSLRW
jgi:very-short-patch-repair endonuclease